ncbi:MAG: hypothetical protein HUJ54_04410 [Erysipelotrichaceae bacterium]|nr:hypothetical protein [Erysipelotrichaceae bacterium]
MKHSEPFCMLAAAALSGIFVFTAFTALSIHAESIDGQTIAQSSDCPDNFDCIFTLTADGQTDAAPAKDSKAEDSPGKPGLHIRFTIP